MRDNCLTFRSFVQALHLSTTGNRRNRYSFPSYNREDVNPLPASQPIRNPVTWSNEKAGSGAGKFDINTLMKAYIEGKASSAEFREYLSKRGIPILGELDQLMRSHDADNSVTYKELARVLLWMGVEEMQNPLQSDPSPFCFEGGEVKLRQVNPSMARKNKRYVFQGLNLSLCAVLILISWHGTLISVSNHCRVDSCLISPEGEDSYWSSGIDGSGIPSCPR